MKTSTFTHRGSPYVVAALAVVAIAGFSLPTLAGEAEPAEVRERLHHLERKAQELKAEGQHDKARQVMLEIEEYWAQAQQTKERQSSEKVRVEEQRRAELKRKLGEAQAELARLSAAGKQAEAAELKQRVHRLEEELARPAKQPARVKAMKREGLEQPGAERGPKAASAETEALEARSRHLREAIGNLHAAGMHDVAEHLAQQAEQLKLQSVKSPSPMARGPAPMGAEVEHLRAEIQELRQAVRELRARVEELGRDRR